MKMMTYIDRLLIGATALLTLLSCAARVEIDDELSLPYTYTMTFDCVIENDTYVATKSVYQWEDGARVHLQLQNGNSRIKGVAIYSDATGEWTLTTDKAMAQVELGSCEAYWFRGLVDSTSDTMTLGPEIAPFMDIDATYTLGSDKRLIVKACLSPMTSRLRFIGEPGKSYEITGLLYCTTYSLSTNSFSRSSDPFTITIGEQGESEYCYVLFADTSERELTLSGDHNTLYIRTFSEDVLVTGSSGFMTIPTPASLGKWTLVDAENMQEVLFPIVGETLISDIKGWAAGVSSRILDLGNGKILSSGFVYGVEPEPTIEASLSMPLEPSDVFSVRIACLEGSTKYYVRAYSSNPRGLSYGPQTEFTTTGDKPDIEYGDGFDTEQDWNDNWDEGRDATDGGSITKDDWSDYEDWNSDWEGNTGDADADGVGKDDWSDDKDWNQGWGDGEGPVGDEDLDKEDWPEDDDWNQGWGNGDDPVDDEGLDKDGWPEDEEWN